MNFWPNTLSAEERKGALPILSFPAVQKLNITVRDLVQSAPLQAQVMEFIATETDTLAAVSPMDLSVEAEAFGAEVRFSDDEVPAIVGQLVADEDQAKQLAVPDLTKGRAATAVAGIRLAKQRITNKPILAGMIGPCSLAGRLMDVTEIIYMCYDEPEAVHIVLQKATEYLIQYANALKAAGANGIMMAEPLTGILSPNLAEEFSVPYVRRIIDAVQDEGFSVIYHNCGNAVGQMLPQIFSQGAAAYHFGNAVQLHEILSNAPANVAIMGNVDPAGVLRLGTPDTVRAATRALLENCSQFPGFIASSGCDIPPQTPWENIQAFFEAVHTFYEQ